MRLLPPVPDLHYLSDDYLYTSSNGLVSEKHESQTLRTTLEACSSPSHLGRAMTDLMARVRTQCWNCWVRLQLFLVKASLVHLHSPLSMEARICTWYVSKRNPKKLVEVLRVAHLCAGCVLQVLVSHPVDLPPEVIPRVNHLVRQRILEVLSIPNLVCAEKNTVVRAEATGLAMDLTVLGQTSRTASAEDI